MRARLFSIALVFTLLYGGAASAFAMNCLHARITASAAETPACCAQDDETGIAHCPMRTGEESSAHGDASMSGMGESTPAHDAMQVSSLSKSPGTGINAPGDTCQFCVSHSERAPASAQGGNVSVSKRKDALTPTRALKLPDLFPHGFILYTAIPQGEPPGPSRRHVLHNVFLI